VSFSGPANVDNALVARAARISRFAATSSMETDLREGLINSRIVHP
jgi:hypothetical protein